MQDAGPEGGEVRPIAEVFSDDDPSMERQYTADLAEQRAARGVRSKLVCREQQQDGVDGAGCGREAVEPNGFGAPRS